MSLVAAVAVAGMTSANATDLSEAIKNVDISGMMRYRYTDTNVENGKSKVENDYDIEVTAKVPVNDIVTAVVKVDVDGDLRADEEAGAEPADDKPGVNVEDAYFSFDLPYATIEAGKQNVPGPLVDAPNGTGIVAMSKPLGPVTLAGGWFNGTKPTSYADVYALAAMGSFGPVNASVWYADVKDVADAYSIAVDGTVGPVSLDLRYSSKDLDDKMYKKINDNEVLKLGAEATFGMVTVNAGFAKTGDDNGRNGGAALDGETDALANDFQLEQRDVASEMNNAKAFKLGVEVAPVEKVTVGLDYLQAKHDVYSLTNSDRVTYKEYVLSAAYKMSKNFKISSYFSKAKDGQGFGADDVKTSKGRLELKYSF